MDTKSESLALFRLILAGAVALASMPPVVVFAGVTPSRDPGQSTKDVALPDLNDLMMETTFKIVGQGSQGTAFVIGREVVGEPGRARMVLVTAAHVVEEMVGDNAVLIVRQKTPDGNWTRTESPLRIRENGRLLWTKHPKADVVVAYLTTPLNLIPLVVPTALLAEDADLQALNLHPGDEVNCLGFPMGIESSSGGFPVLRTGRIASYPVVGPAGGPTFLLDLNVFPGNSGGPCYLAQFNRMGPDGAAMVGRFQAVLGLVSQQVLVSEEQRGVYLETKQHSLGLAIVIRSAVIRETLLLLPP